MSTIKQQRNFLESIKMINSLEKAYREKTTFEKKFLHFLNEDFDKIIQHLDFKKVKNKEDKYRAKKIREYREQALLVLNDQLFTERIKTLSEKWALDKYKYPVSLISFYEQPTPFSIQLWENKLLNETFKSIVKNGEKIKIIKQRIVKQYLKDSDFEKLKRGFSEMYASFNFLWKFEKDINELLLQYDFNEFWKNSIIGFLLSGNLILPIEYCRGIIKYDENNNIPILSIAVFPDTTLEDINCKWKDIKKMKNQLYPLRRKRRKLTKNIEKVINLRQDYNKRWDLVEKDYKGFKKRLQAIEALRKSETRIRDKQKEIINRGLKRKLARPPSSIKEFEDNFGRIFKTHYF